MTGVTAPCISSPTPPLITIGLVSGVRMYRAPNQKESWRLARGWVLQSDYTRVYTLSHFARRARNNVATRYFSLVSVAATFVACVAFRVDFSAILLRAAHSPA